MSASSVIKSIKKSRPVRSSLRTFRVATARSRCLPDFLIIGSQKSGTTSLFAYLRQHDQLLTSSTKEVHYFDGGLNPSVDNFQKGELWYRAHFPFRQSMRANQKVFEASPLYMFNPCAAQRIAALLPDAKLICIVRDPAERAISHYFHERRRGRETLEIMDAFEAEEERIGPAVASGNYKDSHFIHFSYKSRGHYYSQLLRYLEHFDSDRLLVLDAKQLRTSPHSILQQVFKFVGVKSDVSIKDVKFRNVGNGRGEVGKKVYQYLQSYFRPHNEAFFDFMKARYDW